jgi:hypothetical protein
MCRLIEDGNDDAEGELRHGAISNRIRRR